MPGHGAPGRPAPGQPGSGPRPTDQAASGPRPTDQAASGPRPADQAAFGSRPPGPAPRAAAHGAAPAPAPLRPGEVSQPLPARPEHAQPGDVSRPLPGRARQAPPEHAAPPDHSGQPFPDRPGAAGQSPPGRRDDPAQPGEISRPLQGRAAPAPPAHGNRPRPDAGASPVRGTGAVPPQGRVSGAVPAGAAAVPSRPEDEPARAVSGAAAVGASSRAVASVRNAADAGPVPGGPGDPAGPDEAARPGGVVAGWREKLRTQRRLRVIALVSLSVLVLGLLPLFFGIRAATRDPVFTSLDALDVPGWAAQRVDDKSSGSRWCFLDCRFRERTAQSQRPFEETATAYANALTAAGWRPWQVGSCPEQPVTDGRYTCWKRDEFTLDLWVRLPECAVDAVAAQDPATLPSPGPDGVVPTAKPEDCVGSTVSIKVQNAITDQRGKPQPQPDPSLIGETPDPVLSNDPLLDPTPSPS